MFKFYVNVYRRKSLSDSICICIFKIGTYDHLPLLLVFDNNIKLLLSARFQIMTVAGCCFRGKFKTMHIENILFVWTSGDNYIPKQIVSPIGPDIRYKYVSTSKVTLSSGSVCLFKCSFIEIIAACDICPGGQYLSFKLFNLSCRHKRGWEGSAQTNVECLL